MDGNTIEVRQQASAPLKEREVRPVAETMLSAGLSPEQAVAMARRDGIISSAHAAIYADAAAEASMVELPRGSVDRRAVVAGMVRKFAASLGPEDGGRQAELRLHALARSLSSGRVPNDTIRVALSQVEAVAERQIDGAGEQGFEALKLGFVLGRNQQAEARFLEMGEEVR